MFFFFIYVQWLIALRYKTSFVLANMHSDKLKVECVKINFQMKIRGEARNVPKVFEILYSV